MYLISSFGVKIKIEKQITLFFYHSQSTLTLLVLHKTGNCFDILNYFSNFLLETFHFSVIIFIKKARELS